MKHTIIWLAVAVLAPAWACAATVDITSASGTALDTIGPNSPANVALFVDDNDSNNSYYFKNRPLFVKPDRLYNMSDYRYVENTDRDVWSFQFNYGGIKVSDAFNGDNGTFGEVSTGSLSGLGGMAMWYAGTQLDANAGGAELALNGEATPNLRLADPTITGSATAISGYEVGKIFDGSAQPTGEYASSGQGVNTYIDFDFGAPTTLGYFDLIQRGVDRASAFDVILSTDSTFGNGDDVVFGATMTDTSAYGAGWTSLVNLGGTTAQHVRWDVTATANGSNVGAAEIAFYGIPEPATLGLLGMAGVALLMRRRR